MSPAAQSLLEALKKRAPEPIYYWQDVKRMRELERAGLARVERVTGLSGARFAVHLA